MLREEDRDRKFQNILSVYFTQYMFFSDFGQWTEDSCKKFQNYFLLQKKRRGEGGGVNTI